LQQSQCLLVNNCFPSMLKGSNLDSKTITLVLTAPPYLVATVIALGIALSSDR
jgi:hypothetical protein